MKLSKAEMQMLARAKTMPIVYDEESPKLSKNELAQFKHYSEINHKKRIKETISLRVSNATKEKLKSLGKGYTGVISRLIDYAFDNPSLLKKCV